MAVAGTAESGLVSHGVVIARAEIGASGSIVNAVSAMSQIRRIIGTTPGVRRAYLD
jgi:hypothetical protein